VNRVREDLKATEKLLLSFKSIVEISANSPEALTSILSAKPQWRKAAVTLITREDILWDKLPKDEARAASAS
jgi:hypothetical protein